MWRETVPMLLQSGYCDCGKVTVFVNGLLKFAIMHISEAETLLKTNSVLAPTVEL